MPVWIRAVALLMLFVTPASAKDIYLGIAGSVGVFRTDTRIFNPSGTKDITVTAVFLPVGQDNSSLAAAQQITIPKRQMRVLNDIVTTLFGATGLGAIRLSSSDDFIATSRIYAGLSAGTLGQFVPGLDATAARAKGILIQLKATGTTAAGTYRTNLGFVNPNPTTTTVSIHRHDANNAEIGAPLPLTIAPYGVAFPITLDPASGDLSDGWVSYEASQPLFGFASVIDNGTTDPTFITASEDTGSPIPGQAPSKWYLSPILNFELSSTPKPVSSGAKQLCFSSMSFTTTLPGDLAGTMYNYSLVLVSSAGSGEGRYKADIVLRSGTAETILATNTFVTTSTLEVKTATVSGPDPTAQQGDTLLIRFTTTSGQPCLFESNGAGTTNFIEITGQ